MILAGDFRKGITVEIDGQVWSIADFQHVKPGKGAAFVRTKAEKRHDRCGSRKNLQPHRQVSHCTHRNPRNAVSLY